MSLDGYIATSDGGVDWLPAMDSGSEDYGFSEFSASIDTLLVGSKTYEQSLQLGGLPLQGRPTWVFSRRPLKVIGKELTVTNQGPAEVLADLDQRGLKRAWLVGGATLASSFRSAGLISEYIITVIPTILGIGIPLIEAGGEMEKLSLIETKEFKNGFVQLKYRKLSDD